MELQSLEATAHPTFMNMALLLTFSDLIKLLQFTYHCLFGLKYPTRAHTQTLKQTLTLYFFLSHDAHRCHRAAVHITMSKIWLLSTNLTLTLYWTMFWTWMVKVEVTMKALIERISNKKWEQIKGTGETKACNQLHIVYMKCYLSFNLGCEGSNKNKDGFCCVYVILWEIKPLEFPYHE